MTCELCTAWCATTVKQYVNRMDNLRASRGEPYPCPNCGGTEWATTRAMIRQENETTTIWQRLKRIFRG